MESKSCNCGSDDKLVIACSGAADLGHISDEVARKLSKETNRKMSCMALFATCSNEKIEDFKSNDILVIDGCNLDCGKKIMQQRGIEDYTFLRLTDLGYEKGKTPFEPKTIDAIFKKAASL